MPPSPPAKPSTAAGESCGRGARSTGGFTLVELMVALGVLSLILVLLLGVVSHTSALTSGAGDRISTFQAARAAFDLVTKNLSQATLNTYWDYDNPARPERYLRMSELHFLVGQAGAENFPGTQGTGQAVFFQAPLGVAAEPQIRDLTDLLNGCGFFIEYGLTEVLPAPFPAPPPRYRFQLMQALEIAEDLSVYQTGSEGENWYADLAAGAVPIAENVIFFSAWPRRSPSEDSQGNELTSTFSYDSRLNALQSPEQPVTAHQMPPMLQVTMVVLDERSAVRICEGPSRPPEIVSAFQGLFQTSSESAFLSDMKALEENLAGAGLNFRVFTARIAVRESKME